MKLERGSPQEAGMSEERVQRIVDSARGWVAQGIHPALVILVARKGVIFIHEAFGRLRPEQDAPPVELDTIFPLRSLTKPITATAAMILVEDGLLGLNRPVSWYIPEFVGKSKHLVTIHHLLTHTSGLRDEELTAYAEEKKVVVEIPSADETAHPLVHERLCLRYGAPLWKPPGTEMSYCDYGYQLLAEIVRRVSGQSVPDFYTQRIFAPLGMKNTSFKVPDPQDPRSLRRPPNVPWSDIIDNPDWAGPLGSAGANSTVQDMAIFGQTFLNRGRYGDARILCPTSVAEMTRNQIPGISAQMHDRFFPEATWGLGWNVRGTKKSVFYAETLQSPETFSHGGAGGVFLWVDPVHEIVGAYFSVSTYVGIPKALLEPDWMRVTMATVGRADLLINAVTAAIVD